MDLIADTAGFSSHLAPAAKSARHFRNRHCGNFIGFPDPTPTHQQYPQGMNATFIHQGTRHHIVVSEVTGQEPILGVDGQLSFDHA